MKPIFMLWCAPLYLIFMIPAALLAIMGYSKMIESIFEVFDV